MSPLLLFLIFFNLTSHPSLLLKGEPCGCLSAPFILSHQPEHFFTLCVLVLKVHFFIFSNQSGINYCLGQFSPQRPSEDPFKPGRQGRVSAAGGCAQADPPRHLSASPRQTKKTCLHSPAAVRWSHDCCPHRKKRHQKDEKWCTQSIQRT